MFMKLELQSLQCTCWACVYKFGGCSPGLRNSSPKSFLSLHQGAQMHVVKLKETQPICVAFDDFGWGEDQC